MGELDDAVDALLSRPANVLPPPEVRARLRKASGLTQEEVAQAFGVHRMAFLRWENGQAMPRAKHRDAYARLLKGWAEKHPQAAQAPAPSTPVGG